MNPIKNCGIDIDKIQYLDEHKMIFKAFNDTWYINPMNKSYASNIKGDYITILYKNGQNHVINNISFKYNKKTWFVCKNINFRMLAYNKKEIFIIFNHYRIKLGENSDIFQYLHSNKEKIFVNDYHCNNLFLLMKYGDLSQSDKKLISELIKNRMKNILY